GRHPLSAGKREAFRHGDRARRAGRGAPGDARRLAGGQRRPAGGPAGLHGRGLCRAPAQGRAGAGRDDPAHRGGDRQEPGEDRQVSIERDTSEGSSPSRRGATHVFAAYVMLLSILPLLGLGFASFEISRSALQNEAERHLTQLLHERKRFIDLQTEQVEGLIANVSGVEAITTGLAAPYDPADDYTRLLMQARIGYILNGYVNLKGLVSIDIFARNGAHYHVGDTLDVGHIRRELREHLHSASGDFDWTADGGKLLVKYLRSEPSGWLLVGFIPLAAINAQAATIAKATALVVLLCLGLALAAAVSYSRRVVRPLRRI